MASSLTERIQESRLTVVEVDPSHGRIRVRARADQCTDLTCSERTVVITDEGTTGLAALNPGDIVKVESADERLARIVVVRRVWEEIASPEL